MPRQYRTSTVSRERNRVHAQRTRQRKKEQMNSLQTRVSELKEEQIELKQVINEKNTASILVGLFAKNKTSDEAKIQSNDDPKVEDLLKRPVEEIPDASMIPELPALILPGQHASKKLKISGTSNLASSLEGIDFELLSRDRSKCSPEELDKIRRERNRMHAKRTRDRKRLFTEKLAEMSRILEEENDTLKAYLAKIDPDYHYTKANETSGYSSMCTTPPLVSPRLPSSEAPDGDFQMKDISLDRSSMPCLPAVNSQTENSKSLQPASRSKSSSLGHLSTLLKVAGCFEEQASKKRPLSELLASAISEIPSCNSTSGAEESDATINTDDDDNNMISVPDKRNCPDDIPKSITAGGF